MTRQDKGVPAPPSGHSDEPAGGLAANAGSVPNAGDVFTITYPFVRGTYQDFDSDGPREVATWLPGTRWEDYSPEDVGAVADAVGEARFTVIGVFKPGRFPTRVFFTRKFVDPDGREFGKGKLHIATLDKFRRTTKGYQHVFGIGEPIEARFGPSRVMDAFDTLMAELAAHSSESGA